MASPDIVTVCGKEIRLTDRMENIIHSFGVKKIRDMMKPADKPDNTIVSYGEFDKDGISKIIFGFIENTVLYNGITSEMYADEIKDILEGKCAVLRHDRFKEIYTIYNILFEISNDGKINELKLYNMPDTLKNGTPENTSQFEYERGLTKLISQSIPRGGCILHYMISCENERSKGFISAVIYRRSNIFKDIFSGNVYKKLFRKDNLK